MCEDVYAHCLVHDGLVALVARDRHVSIQETTKKTMLGSVVPPHMIAGRKGSQGEDWVRLKNGSTIHFIGLDDPVRWFSSEIGMLAFDEAHEIAEDDVLVLISRLRQAGVPEHLRQVIITFNPDNPGHWLYKWFIDRAQPVYRDGVYVGTRKDELLPTDGDQPLGDADFFFAKAQDNPYLSERYVRSFLGGMKPLMRRRFLEGEWLFTSGRCFFDLDALAAYEDRIEQPFMYAVTDDKPRPRFRSQKNGPWLIWKPPKRQEWNPETSRIEPAHRYVISVDVSSGTAADYSAIQVIDREEFAQVAEFQGKPDADQLALEVYRAALVYNEALVAPEVTGGWGHTIKMELRRLGYGRMYTRPDDGRLSRKYTDRVGWDTTSKSRAHMLDTLERVLREGEFGLRSQRTLHELQNFVRDDNGKPAAQPGMSDDLVISLAIAVTIADQMPRQQRRQLRPVPQPEYASTGW